MSRIGIDSVRRVLVVMGLLVLFASAPIGGESTMGNCSLQTAVNCTT
ncbi:MAG: hypothetical protein GY943_02155 [Chloroflexi bacterium]|nr:hypothetical protein [Chloroflexota bacterium]